MVSNEPAIYSAPRRLLHWGMALLLIAMIVGVELHDSFPKGSTLRSLLMDVHTQFGLLVFLLIWPRLLLAWRGNKPPVVPQLPAWQEKLAALIHFALYASMASLPVIGVLVIQSGDKSVSLLGLQLPQLIGANKDVSHNLREVHETLGNIVIGLIVLHVAAAVWHHRILRDNTLTRMLST
ncbi:MAG: cytochrome b [Gallionellaceae bacterium]